MKQVVHIFRKDVRHLYPEILLVAILAISFSWRDAWWVDGLLLVAAAFLMARVIHDETIPGDRQFWITRPYRWTCLAAAKLIFILAFVNVPLFLAQFVILIRGGFPLSVTWPGLLWSQVLLILCFSLPVAGLAVLTSNLLTFLFATLVLLLIGSSVPQMILPAIALAPSLPQWPQAVQWVRDSAALLMLTAIVATIVYVQYKSRRTRWSRSFALGSLAATGLLYLYLPSDVGLNLQTRFSRRTFPGSALAISADERKIRVDPVRWTDRLVVRLPLTVSGIPDGDTLKADALTLSFLDANGVWQSQTAGSAVRSGGEGIAYVQATAMMPPLFRPQAKGRPLTFRGSIYFTLFGNRRDWKIPLRDTPVNVADGLQCNRGAFQSPSSATLDNQLYCRSIFRWPAREVLARVRKDLNSFNELISYSPFPAVLDLNPIESHWASGGSPSDQELTIVTREPLATVRRDFEVRGVSVE